MIKTGFGTGRLVFICPTCDKNYSSLFIIDSTLGCRKCFNLEYASKSSSKYIKAQQAIIKKRLKFWGTEHPVHGGDIYNLFETSSANWIRPKSMRKSKWEVERAKLEELEAIYLEYIKITCGI